MQLNDKERFILFTLVVDKIRIYKADLRARKRVSIKKDDIYEKIMKRIGMGRKEVKVTIWKLRCIRNSLLWSAFILSFIRKTTTITFTKEQKELLINLLKERVEDIEIQDVIPHDLCKLAFSDNNICQKVNIWQSIAQKLESSA